jgi:hypothetical protein
MGKKQSWRSDGSQRLFMDCSQGKFEHSLLNFHDFFWSYSRRWTSNFQIFVQLGKFEKKNIQPKIIFITLISDHFLYDIVLSSSIEQR